MELSFFLFSQVLVKGKYICVYVIPICSPKIKEMCLDPVYFSPCQFFKKR